MSHFKNDHVKDKKCKVKVLLSNLLPPPGNRKAKVSTSCSGLSLAHARLSHCSRGRVVSKAGHTLLTLPERAVLPFQRPEEIRSCPVKVAWTQHCSYAVYTCCWFLHMAYFLAWCSHTSRIQHHCQKLHLPLLGEGHKVHMSLGQLPTACSS